MKQRLSTYTFSPAARTIDFSGVAGFDVRGLLAIINGGVTLYAAGSQTLAPASIAGSVVTLNAGVSTAGMMATDPLLVLYDDAVSPASATKQDAANASLAAIASAVAAPLKSSLVDSNANAIFRGNPLPVRRVESIMLPWRAEEIKYANSSNAGVWVGQPPENDTSTPYNSDYWAGGYDLPVLVTVNAGAVGAGTMTGARFEFRFTGSLFGIVQTVQYPSTDFPGWPMTAVIDGVAYPGDPRVPLEDFAVTPTNDPTLLTRAVMFAEGLHPGNHHCVMQFAMDPAGVVNRTWLLNAKILERNAHNQAPPPTEIAANAQAITIGQSSAAPTLIPIRSVAAPPVLGITCVVFSNAGNAAAPVFWRTRFPNGPGVGAAFNARMVPPGDSVVVKPSGARFWPQEIEAWSPATTIVARPFYQR